MKRARVVLCLRNQLSSLRTISAITLLRNLADLSLFEAKRAIESLVEKGGATVLDMTLPENPEKLIQELLEAGVRAVIDRELNTLPRACKNCEFFLSTISKLGLCYGHGPVVLQSASRAETHWPTVAMDAFCPKFSEKDEVKQ